MDKLKLCIPVSGVGSILEAFISVGVKPDLVIADRPCRGEQIASKNEIPLEQLYRRNYYKHGKFDRAAYTAAFIRALQDNKIDIIAMAGFLTVLSPSIFEDYPGRLINTHTSLFEGMSAVWPGSGEDAVKSVLATGQPEAGATVHLATEVLDTGPVLAMFHVAVLPNDTVDSLWERIKVGERKLYPSTIKRVLAGEIELDAKWQEWIEHRLS